jgi:hypothetical protein
MHPWAHVYSAYLGQWLPGDPRNFNSRRHRIHSERRVYVDDPPLTEHRALYSHGQALLKKKVFINTDVAPHLLEALRLKLCELEVPTAALACHCTHFHALIKVGDQNAKPLFGRAKQAGSHAVRAHVPGRLWGRSSGVTRMRGFRHFASAFWYILAHKEQGAVVWRNEAIERECETKYPNYRKSVEYQLLWHDDA